MTARILVVDDIEANRRLLQAKLEAQYHTVLLAENGPQALEVARQEHPEIILLDVMMPGMDGPETLARLRECIDLEKIPVAFMTAKVQSSEIDHLRKLGARDVIIKPFDPMRLAEQIRSIWSAGRY